MKALLVYLFLCGMFLLIGCAPKVKISENNTIVRSPQLRAVDHAVPNNQRTTSFQTGFEFLVAPPKNFSFNDLGGESSVLGDGINHLAVNQLITTRYNLNESIIFARYKGVATGVSLSVGMGAELDNVQYYEYLNSPIFDMSVFLRFTPSNKFLTFLYRPEVGISTSRYIHEELKFHENGHVDSLVESRVDASLLFKQQAAIRVAPLDFFAAFAGIQQNLSVTGIIKRVTRKEAVLGLYGGVTISPSKFFAVSAYTLVPITAFRTHTLSPTAIGFSIEGSISGGLYQ